MKYIIYLLIGVLTVLVITVTVLPLCNKTNEEFVNTMTYYTFGSRIPGIGGYMGSVAAT